MLIGMAFMLAFVGIWFQLWVLCAFAILAVVASRMFAHRRSVNEPERSPRLRLITFAAQSTGILALAFVSELWIVALVSVVVLAIGHVASYRYVEKVPLALRLTTFVALHLVFGWIRRRSPCW
jgi:hypothetical protein